MCVGGGWVVKSKSRLYSKMIVKKGRKRNRFPYYGHSCCNSRFSKGNATAIASSDCITEPVLPSLHFEEVSSTWSLLAG